MSEQLRAGPELDQLIHTKIKGAKGTPPSYSTDIAEAWELWKGKGDNHEKIGIFSVIPLHAMFGYVYSGVIKESIIE